MNESYHHIRRLYLEKLTGTISEDEDFELGELLRNNIEAQLTWESLEKERRDLNADIILERIDPEQELEDWNSRFAEDGKEEQEATVPVWSGWWKWAVAVFCIGFSYFFFDRLLSDNHSGSEVTVIDQESVATDEIKLTLADGNSVIFSDIADKYSVGGMQLESSGNQLKYAGEGQDSSAFNTLKVPAAKDYSITLSDGTRVFLNSETTLRFPFYFSGETREIFIEGEAYLEVAEDARKPFIVHTPLTHIHVLGTRFNVNTYDKGVVRTSLVEGKVLLQTENRKPLQLLPGQEAAYSEAKGFITTMFDASEVLAWREGVFYFQHQPLEDLSGIISRWFDIEVVFEEENLARHPVSGMIEKGHLEEFLHDLNKTSGIDYTLDDRILTLK